MNVLWVCDCQSADVRRRADGGFTVLTPGGACQWCGRNQQQVSDDADTRVSA